MSPFIIFVIVLTIAYILYYIAVITLELRNSSKQESSAVETITADEAEGDEDDIVALKVVENSDSGGFSVMNPLDILEIEEETSEDEAIEDNPTDDAEERQADKPSQLPEPYNEPESSQEEGSNDNDEPKSEILEDKQDEDSTDPEEEFVNISTISFSEEPEPAPSKVFDANDAFDPQLARGAYGVTSIIEPQANDELKQRIEDVQETLMSISTETQSYRPCELKRIMMENRQNSNIEYKDEFSKL